MVSKETAALLLQVLLQVKLNASDDDLVKKAMDITKAKGELMQILKAPSEVVA